MPGTLYATRSGSDTIAKSIEVFDDNGRTFIHKVQPNGRVIDWHSDLTPAGWVAHNNVTRRSRKCFWLDASGNVIKPGA